MKHQIQMNKVGVNYNLILIHDLTHFLYLH